MENQKYPIGIQDFAKLREENYVYVDKTKYIYQMLQGAYYFLSRPRRFGKSLLVNTLYYLFEGRKELFKGLWIEEKIEWKKHPIIKFDFSELDFEKNLEKTIKERLFEIAKNYNVTLTKTTAKSLFRELIMELSKIEKVVILIDEYDKPIGDFLEKDKMEMAIKNRDILKRFYSTLKGLDAHIRFFFLTGITKFSKVSIFSDLNNLDDLTLHPDFGELLGYTQTELEFYFSDKLKEIALSQNLPYDDFLDKVKIWYNGYNFLGNQKVYNPFSMLRFLSNRRFSNFWFETGTPSLLVKLLYKKRIFDVDNVLVTENIFNNFNLENINEITLFYQTGYLTIKEDLGTQFILTYPNLEVKKSMFSYLLYDYSGLELKADSVVYYIEQSLLKRDFELLKQQLNVLFGSIPADIFEKELESYYHAIIFLTFQLLGYKMQAEVRTSKGRIDAILEYNNAIFLFEFKVNKTPEIALKQIKDREYFQKYLQPNKEIYLIGVNCYEKEIKEILYEKYQ